MDLGGRGERIQAMNAPSRSKSASVVPRPAATRSRVPNRLAIARKPDARPLTMGRSTVMRHIKNLRILQLLFREIVHRRNGGKAPNRYRVNLDALSYVRIVDLGSEQRSDIGSQKQRSFLLPLNGKAPPSVNFDTTLVSPVRPRSVKFDTETLEFANKNNAVHAPPEENPEEESDLSKKIKGDSLLAAPSEPQPKQPVIYDPEARDAAISQRMAKLCWRTLFTCMGT